MATPSRTLSKQGLAGLAILVVSVVGLLAIAAAPFFWLRDLTAQVTASHSELALAETKINTGGGGHRLPLALRKNFDMAYVGGQTQGLAQAELQRLVGELATSNGLVIEKIQLLETEPQEGAAPIRMEVETSGSLDGLRGYLHAIETGMPLIFIREANVAAAANGVESSKADPSSNLLVRLDIEAFGWSEKMP